MSSTRVLITAGLLGFSRAAMPGALDTKVGPRCRACRVFGAMRWLSSIILLVSLSSCLQVGKGSDSGPSADDGSSGGSTVGSSASATGTNCGVDSSTGVSLCLGISSCPGARVDPDQFPECGYRIAGSAIDLECLCGDSLCPMGSAASCLDAKALLAEQSAQAVCAGVAEGRCQVVKQTSRSSSRRATGIAELSAAAFRAASRFAVASPPATHRG
jgi:hypothetical protein